MTNYGKAPERETLAQTRSERTAKIAKAGGLKEALATGGLPSRLDLTLSEALILGLLRQDVRTFICVLGHGSTDVGEVLRHYAATGLLRVVPVRSEIEASHAAAALRWITGEKAAVVTSIGPGALQAMAASLAPAANGLGVWYIFGDETTEDEGYNMQQIPKPEQSLFLKLFSTMGAAYSLHTPLSLPTALQRGRWCVDNAQRGAPFFLLLPMNTQATFLPGFNLAELPGESALPVLGASNDKSAYEQAILALRDSKRLVIRAGGGAREAGLELIEFAELCDGVVVTSPLVSGVLPYRHPRNMTVAGSKGSLSGNYAMEHADCLLVVGSRSVCQSDSSRTAYPNVKRVIAINSDPQDALHYGCTIPLVGEARTTLARLNELLRAAKGQGTPSSEPSEWLAACMQAKTRWDAFKAERYAKPICYDEKWGQDLLTQPAAIKAASDWARSRAVVSIFDAGDVQANGFQIVEDEHLGQTFTETGASYMGFAVSALLATGLARQPFYGLAMTGDGSFSMCPQVLIDGVTHGARGCILLFDNRRMGAISSLQHAQYGHDFATDDQVVVDYAAWAASVRGVLALRGGTSIESLLAALDEAHAYQGLSLIHLPVYYGHDPMGGLGAWGRWNVGNWVHHTQALRHDIGL